MIGGASPVTGDKIENCKLQIAHRGRGKFVSDLSRAKA
jgi:hypothetical protein